MDKKKIIAILLACVMMMAQMAVFAANEETVPEDAQVELMNSAGTYYEEYGLYFDKDSGTITGYGDDLKSKLEIPDKIDGIIVTEIVDSAFSGCRSLTSVTISDSVTSIGDSAFYECRGLTNITIPDSVTEIRDSAFEGCSGLTSISVGTGNKNYTSEDGVLFNKDKTQLIQCPIGSAREQYTIPDSVTEIGYSAFSGCRGLTSITIPESVTEIGYYAFSGCRGLTSITIPDSVTSIGDGTFSGCSDLTSIIVDTENKKYTSENGALFNKDKTELIQYPIGSTREQYDIPDSVTEIGDSAFLGCSGLTSITIPDSITEIGDSAFSECSGLTSITIPDSVTSIDIMHFQNVAV